MPNLKVFKREFVNADSLFFKGGLMDDDIREDLGELGRHVQAVGRIIASKRSNMSSIELMSSALLTAAETLDEIIEIQQSRYVYEKT